MNRKLVSTTKAAHQLNVSPNTVRTFIAEGKIKGYQVGRLIKVDQAEVDNFATPIEYQGIRA
ncbi:helix-turn-helix domain-containing protein [Mycobacterium sp. DL]|uniref:helix-turn-helix domain-containing protein n=1 Tax=Mycobacteriaceae TaxID=1762 RepID=UPI00321A7BA9